MHPGPNPIPPTERSPIRASRMRIILDCRDASTVPSVLDLLTLMDQDCPTPDRNYVDALSEFYDFGVEDVVDVYGMPCGILASLGDIGRDRAHQLQDYARDKLLLPLGLLETGLKVEKGVGSAIVKKQDDSSVVELGVGGPVVKKQDDSSVVSLGVGSPAAKKQDSSSIIELGVGDPVVKKQDGSSIVELGGQHSIIEVRSSSVDEVGVLCSVVGAGMGGEGSVVKMAAADTLPQAPVVVNGLMKQSADEEEDEEEEEEEEEEGWPEESGWSIGEVSEERILEWLAGVREAGGNGEGESATSFEV